MEAIGGSSALANSLVLGEHDEYAPSIGWLFV
jgi:hypothetical protein